MITRITMWFFCHSYLNNVKRAVGTWWNWNFWHVTCGAQRQHLPTCQMSKLPSIMSKWWMAHVSVCSSFQTYLSLRQAEADSQFGFPPDGDVSVEMKLFLQLQPLVVCINYSVLLLRSCFACEVDKSTHYNFSISRPVCCFHFKSLCIYFCGQVVKLEDSHSGDMHSRTGLSAHGIFISLRFKSTSILLQKRKLGRFILRLQM